MTAMLFSPPAIYIGLCVLVWLLFSYTSIKEIIRIRSAATVSSIGKIPSKGTVEIIGRAGIKTTVSPITQTDCVLWKVEVSERRKNLTRNTVKYHWVTVFTEISKEPFDVMDRTGKIRIFPDAKTEFRVNASLAANSNSSAVNPQIHEKLTRLGVETIGLLGSERKLEVVESMIKTGDQVYILGHVRDDHGINVIASHNSDSLIISDISHRNTRVHYLIIAFMGFMIIVFGTMLYSVGIHLLSK